jgi:hypothetical protein
MNKPVMARPPQRVQFTLDGPIWRYKGHEIRKMQWCMPSTSTSYRLIINGKVVAEQDTLREMREEIAAMVEDGTLAVHEATTTTQPGQTGQGE